MLSCPIYVGTDAEEGAARLGIFLLRKNKNKKILNFEVLVLCKNSYLKPIKDHRYLKDHNV